MYSKNEYLQYKVLDTKYRNRGYDLVDHAINNDEDVPVRNMCAKVHPALIERLEHTCELIGVSKRRFIESAVAHAIREVDEMIDQHFPDEE